MMIHSGSLLVCHLKRLRRCGRDLWKESLLCDSRDAFETRYSLYFDVSLTPPEVMVLHIP